MQPKVVPALNITQAEIPGLVSAFRITAYPLVSRVLRQMAGGGFGDQSRHPYTWTVLLQIDGAWAQVESARGSPREWGSLDRLERWLRAHGFRHFWVQNDLDPVEDPEAPMSEFGRLK